jgi:hypothetical protein
VTGEPLTLAPFTDAELAAIARAYGGRLAPLEALRLWRLYVAEGFADFSRYLAGHG